MPCAMFASNSPVMSLSPRVSLSPLFRKPSLSSPVTFSIHSPNTSQSSSKSTPFPLSPLAFRRWDFESEDPSCSTTSSQTSLTKRKRPPMLHIPVASSLTSDFPALKTPAEADRLNELEMEGDGYFVYCKRGRRGPMEDRYSAYVGKDSEQALFGVFDGHGGVKAAEFAAKNLGRNIMNAVSKRCDHVGMEEAVKDGYLTTDDKFLKEELNGGTCCVTALIRKGNLIVSNAGDCRAVLCRGGVAEALTTDHRPSRVDEKERIQSSGGYVDCCRQIWRVQGTLAVSRAVGDRHLKQWVIAEPDTKIVNINPECEFLVLASDGLWDKVGDQEAVDLIRSLCVGTHNSQPIAACKKLVDLSVTRGSTDDVSVMVIQLDRFIS